MNKEDMKLRTKQYALRVIKLVEKLPRTRTFEVIGRQLLRSGTSVGANYRSACRAKSRADFISKMGTVEEEADESVYWMETGLNLDEIPEFLDAGNQIVAITISSIKKTKKNRS